MEEFKLYIFAMDKKTADFLREQQLCSACIVDKSEVEPEELRSVLRERTGGAYYWSFTPIVIEYVLNDLKEEWCTYIDADCFFYEDPSDVLERIEEADMSIGIVEHRFRMDKTYDDLVNLNGRFNVSFTVFRNNKTSFRVLNEWKKQCLDCCTGEPGDGVFGDQIYLDEWPSRYEGVCIIEDEGIDAAPWNINNYDVTKQGSTYYLENNNGKVRLSMYHFHALSILGGHIASLNLFNTRPRREEKYIFELYKKYIRELEHQQKIIDTFGGCLTIAEKGSKAAGDTKKSGRRSLFSRFIKRGEKNPVSLYRNIMWI